MPSGRFVTQAIFGWLMWVRVKKKEHGTCNSKKQLINVLTKQDTLKKERNEVKVIKISIRSSVSVCESSFNH